MECWRPATLDGHPGEVAGVDAGVCVWRGALGDELLAALVGRAYGRELPLAIDELRLSVRVERFDVDLGRGLLLATLRLL